jgi:VanZ family protein
MALPLRYPRLWLVGGWLLIGLAVIASLSPARDLPHVSGGDKMHHFIAYFSMTLWFAGIYPRSQYVWIGIAMVALGALIEGAQGAMGLGRQADLRDIVANTSGVTVALILACIGLGGWTQWVEKRLIRSAGA